VIRFWHSIWLVGLLIWPATALPSGPSLTGEERAAWSSFLSAGYDTYIQTFPLATSDTTETIADFSLAAGLTGRSARHARHGWSLRTELSAGSELYREQFAGAYRFRPDGETTRLRFDTSWLGRQYRSASEYGLTSDTHEAKVGARWYPTVSNTLRSELRVGAGGVRYATPSTLELDHDDVSFSGRLRSPRFAERPWEFGVRATRRSYPDSAQIDRRIYGVNTDLSFGDLEGTALRVYHRSDRRIIAESTVRPDAWNHWTDLYGSAPAGTGRLVLESQNEIWSYDQQQSVYVDSWRCDTSLAYRWGDILGAVWRVGLAVENLAAGDSPETYTQAGLRGGVETYGLQFSASLTLEYGRRQYAHAVSSIGLDEQDSAFDAASEDLASYSDFNYVEIWLMASWFATETLSLEVLANYQPESHTEPSDDTSMAFGSFRLAWRP